MIFAAFERALHWVVLLVGILLISTSDHHFLFIATALSGVIVHIISCLVDTLRVPDRARYDWRFEDGQID
jgi:hypothetical protein